MGKRSGDSHNEVKADLELIIQESPHESVDLEDLNLEAPDEFCLSNGVPIKQEEFKVVLWRLRRLSFPYVELAGLNTF